MRTEARQVLVKGVLHISKPRRGRGRRRASRGNITAPCSRSVASTSERPRSSANRMASSSLGAECESDPRARLPTASSPRRSCEVLIAPKAAKSLAGWGSQPVRSRPKRPEVRCRNRRSVATLPKPLDANARVRRQLHVKPLHCKRNHGPHQPQHGVRGRLPARLQ